MIRKTLELQRMLEDTNLTRREFLGYTSAMGLSVAAASTLWSERALADSPKRGGHMRCGLNDANTIDSLDSHPIQRDDDDRHQSGHPRQHRRCRDRWLGHSEPCGELGSQPRREGVALQDPQGRRVLQREGVVHRGRRQLHQRAPRARTRSPRPRESSPGSATSGSTETDTVVVEVTDANADLPFLFTDYHFSVVPTVDGKADLHSRHGTGCYFLRDFDPGVRTTLERNPNSWQSGEAGFVDSVDILAILDDTSRVNALVSGSVDVINRPDLKTIARLEARPDRADRRRVEQPRVHAPDAHERAAVRQQRLPPGAEVLHPAPGVRRQDPLPDTAR